MFSSDCSRQLGVSVQVSMAALKHATNRNSVSQARSDGTHNQPPGDVLAASAGRKLPTHIASQANQLEDRLRMAG
jgi:hypothetical protein